MYKLAIYIPLFEVIPSTEVFTNITAAVPDLGLWNRKACVIVIWITVRILLTYWVSYMFLYNTFIAFLPCL